MLAAACLGLLFFIAFIEIIRKKAKKFDFLTLFNIVFSLLYPLPALVLEADVGNLSSKTNYVYSTYYSNTQAVLAIFVGYFLVIIGFYSTSAIKMGEDILITSKRSDNFIIGFAIFLLLFSCLSIYVYSMQYGGFLSALSNANLIRAGAEERGALSFFKRFFYFSFFGSYLLGSLIFIKRIKKGRFLLYTIFFISIFISLIASLMVASRSTLIMAFIAFYLVYVLQTGRIYLRLIIPLIPPMAFFILYGKLFFFSLTALPEGYGAVVETFVDTIDENQISGFSFSDFIALFAFPVYSLNAAFNNSYQLRLFIDWIYGFASFLPDKIINMEVPQTISYYNTQYIAGTDEYTIPAGFLASYIYSMSWPGLIIFCFAYGWIGRYLQTILKNHIHNIYWMPFIYVSTAEVWIDFQSSGDPKIFLQTNFWYLVSSLLLFSIATKISFVQRSH